jgi:hypothetical protein
MPLRATEVRSRPEREREKAEIDDFTHTESRCAAPGKVVCRNQDPCDKGKWQNPGGTRADDRTPIVSQTRSKVRRFAMGDDVNANGWNAEPFQFSLNSLGPITRQRPIRPFIAICTGIAMHENFVSTSAR